MTHEIRLATLQSQPVAVVRAHVTRDGIAAFLGNAFAEVMTVLREQGITPTGPPFGRYVPDDDGFEVEAGFPVDRPAMSSGQVEPGELPGGTVAFTVHTGAYEDVGAAYTTAVDWLIDNGLVVSGEAWENYLDEPGVPHPRTEVFVPCRSVAPVGT